MDALLKSRNPFMTSQLLMSLYISKNLVLLNSWFLKWEEFIVFSFRILSARSLASVTIGRLSCDPWQALMAMDRPFILTSASILNFQSCRGS
jgi:hypothetical protein